MPSIVFLGTSAATPTRTRNVTSHALRLDDGKIFLFDCGEGTQHQLLKCGDLKAGKIECIFITHLHGDHLFGLQGLLASLSLFGRVNEIQCVGPEGLQEYINKVTTLSATYLTYPLKVIELKEGETKSLGSMGGLEVSCYPLRHKVSSFGFLVTEADKKGKLDAKKAKELGITSGKDLGKLSKGEDVTLPTGTVVRAQDLIGETRQGRKWVFLGDTSDSSSMVSASQGSDVVVHECTYDASLEEKAIEGGHSTSKMAGLFAEQIGAKRLILTHFSMRYHNPEEGSEDITVEDLVKEAQQYTSAKVEAAADFAKFDL